MLLVNFSFKLIMLKPNYTYARIYILQKKIINKRAATITLLLYTSNNTNTLNNNNKIQIKKSLKSSPYTIPFLKSVQ